jgi:hypothetical protein
VGPPPAASGKERENEAENVPKQKDKTAGPLGAHSPSWILRGRGNF